jgi:hypothetical protein
MAFPNVLGVIAGDAANVNRSPSPRLGVRGVTREGSKNAAVAVTLTTGNGLSTFKTCVGMRNNTTFVLCCTGAPLD